MADSKPPPDVVGLINWPTLVTSLLGAGLLGLVAMWTAQQSLRSDMRRIEDKLDEVVEVIEAAHPRRGVEP